MNSRTPNYVLKLLAGIGIGAGLMYFLDPDRGNRRRHLAWDRAGSAARNGKGQLRRAGENARNHVLGTMAEVRGRVRELVPGERVSDDVLVERVRAELGHRVKHAGAIEVTSSGGRVTLRGPVLSSELPGVVAALNQVRGVRRVDYEIDVRTSAENLPSLQG
jgi:osmotically-inducible protein OsmY